MTNKRMEQTLASLPATGALAAKVAAVHGGTDERLVELKQRFDELVEDLRDETQDAPRQEALATFAASARELTSNYAPPPWACGTLVRYYDALATLDQEHARQTA